MSYTAAALLRHAALAALLARHGCTELADAQERLARRIAARVIAGMSR